VFTASAAVFAHTAAAVLLGWAFFGRYRVNRPPIGVLSLGDVVFMLGAIVTIPFLYLVLPIWIVAGLLGFVTLSAVYMALEPVVARPAAALLLTLALAAADVITIASGVGELRSLSLVVNNFVMLVVVIGIANLWAQSGMRARDAVILGSGLMVYDFIATAQLPLMADLSARLDGLPFAPRVAWPVADSLLSIGLGDLLLATVFPLIMWKAFGRPAGLVAVALALAAIGTLLMLPLQTIFPVMAVLGPLMIVQYAFWRRLGAERTTRQYRSTDRGGLAQP
jgi:hypothetical protein